MPAMLDEDSDAPDGVFEDPQELPFPPVTRQHILNCAYHSWHPQFREITPRSRLIPLPQPFLEYLRADGIVLPPDGEDNDSYSSEEDEDEQEDVTEPWRDTHETIKTTIAKLGGKVMPKLNWSAPKDATWINRNTMECRTPGDIYLLLKSSDFITHDLEHAYDDTADSPCSRPTTESIPYNLVLRKAVPQWNPSVEFRCFVRNRQLLCICQRDINHYDFLFKMSRQLRSLIQQFFDLRLREHFPDENFVFDVYVPAPHKRVWLVDVNPWAPRTDPLLFSWMEILDMPDPPELEPEDLNPEFVRLDLNNVPDEIRRAIESERNRPPEVFDDDDDEEIFAPTRDDRDSDDLSEEDEDDLWLPELRLVKRTDSEAYNFSTPQYSAHKLPRDVVDASQSGEGLRDFVQNWESMLAKRQRQDAELSDSSDDA